MKNTKLLYTVCFLVILIEMAFVKSTYAQSEAGIDLINPNSSPALFYYIAKPGEISMQINIWTAVRRADSL